MAPAERRIVDIGDPTTFALIPPCMDPRFDHRTCDYWEDADRGLKQRRPSWLEARRQAAPAQKFRLPDNPFDPSDLEPQFENPFAFSGPVALPDPFADDDSAVLFENPFAPRTQRERPLRDGVPRKLALLDRGRGVFGSYAKVLLVDGDAVAYCQFGPLSAYPRAQRLRELYAQLPVSPLPAVITCIATTEEARNLNYARDLANSVCLDLAKRGFAAVEAYPDLTQPENERSGATPEFWQKIGFSVAVDDQRFPVLRREL